MLKMICVNIILKYWISNAYLYVQISIFKNIGNKIYKWTVIIYISVSEFVY